MEKGTSCGCDYFFSGDPEMSIRREGRTDTMTRLIIMSSILFLLCTSEYLYASLHAEYAPCIGIQGEVIEVIDGEVFTIAVCDKVKIFREFSYCYDVEAGDSVFFDGDPTRCEVTGFTVMRNGVQCGVICPDANHPVTADKQ